LVSFEDGPEGELHAVARKRGADRAELAEFVAENEPQLLSYSVYFSDDGQMTVVHVRADAASLDHHMAIASPRLASFGDLLTVIDSHLWGTERLGT
jgi:hypothetical protein